MKANSLSDFVGRIHTPPCHVEKSGVLYNSDFRDVIADMREESIDLILTDPPYGIDYRGCNLSKRKAGVATSPTGIPDHNWLINDTRHEALNLFECLLRHASRVLKKGGCLCCCCPSGGRHSRSFTRWARLVDEFLSLKDVVVWDKGHLGLGCHYRKQYELILIGKKPGDRCKWNGGRSTSNVIRCSRAYRRAGDHPTPKPEQLMSHFINLHSNPGDIVLDPFAGHGTTLVAARQMKRRYIGIEIVSEYCSAATERLISPV